MSNTTYAIRTLACALWMGAGIYQGNALGYISALASFLFWAAMRIDRAGYEDQ